MPLLREAWYPHGAVDPATGELAQQVTAVGVMAFFLWRETKLNRELREELKELRNKLHELLTRDRDRHGPPALVLCLALPKKGRMLGWVLRLYRLGKFPRLVPFFVSLPKTLDFMLLEKYIPPQTREVILNKTPVSVSNWRMDDVPRVVSRDTNNRIFMNKIKTAFFCLYVLLGAWLCFSLFHINPQESCGCGDVCFLRDIYPYFLAVSICLAFLGNKYCSLTALFLLGLVSAIPFFFAATGICGHETYSYLPVLFFIYSFYYFPMAVVYVYKRESTALTCCAIGVFILSLVLAYIIPIIVGGHSSELYHCA